MVWHAPEEVCERHAAGVCVSWLHDDGVYCVGLRCELGEHGGDVERGFACHGGWRGRRGCGCLGVQGVFECVRA